MSTTSDKPKLPGIVILASILNFFSMATFFALAGFSALATVFGAAWGLDDYVSRQMSSWNPNPNYSYSLALIFGVAFMIFFMVGLYFLIVGQALLRGKRYGWFIQVAGSTLGVLSLPFGIMTGALAIPISAVLNIIILVMFFRHKTREYFRI